MGLTDNFFELGGHSLLVIKVVSRLQLELGLQLTPQQLFQAPTLGAFADTLEQTGFTIDNPAARPGDEVFSVSDPDQPCGMVVNAAINGAGGVDALVEIKLAAMDGDVRLGSSSGAALKFLAMPYPLDALDL